MASILERNGKYFIMVSQGYDSSGKQIRKTMTWKPDEGMTEKQIEKALNEQAVFFERKVLSGQVLEGSVTFADFAERWFRDYGEPSLAPKTLARYQSMYKRILPEIGHIRLDKLQPHHLMELYRELGNDINRRGISFLPTEKFIKTFEKSGFSKEYLSKVSGIHINTIYNIFKNIPIAEQTASKVSSVLGLSFLDAFVPSKPVKGLTNKTIKHHHRLISSILNQAVYWQVIPSNPAERVKPPKVERTEAKYLDEIQTAKLLELLENEEIHHRTMIKLFLYSGFRRGELCGLEWSDVDFKNNMITVRRTSQYTPEKGIFTKETKTETSDRAIKLPVQVFDMLKSYRVWQLEQRLKMGDRWEEHNRIFTQDNGKPIHPDSLTQYFKKLIAKTDLPQITIHSLRHTNATLLIAAGLPLRTVSSRLGHKSTTITSNIYIHTIRSLEDQAAEVIGDMLKPKMIQNAR